jgi:hypothetical protein
MPVNATGGGGLREARRRCALLCAALALGAPMTSLALRPFDSTDADVAELHAVELELGPLGWMEAGQEGFLAAPAVVVNYGIAPRFELVGQGTFLHGLGAAGDGLAGTEVSAKQVLREGSLQDGAGPSLAAEYGLLLPEPGGEHGTGASLAGIASQRWDFGTLHLDAVAGTTRAHRLSLSGSAILEGPARWTVRPVAEMVVEHERTRPRTLTGLAGAIWQYGDRLWFDLAVRCGRSDGARLRELRGGLTWSFAGG